MAFRLRRLEASETQISGSIRDYLVSIGASDLTQAKGLGADHYAAAWRRAYQETRGPVAYFYRNNVGWATHGQRKVPYGAVGSADLIGSMRDGAQLRIEVKRPGERLSEAQKGYRELCLELGYLHIVAYSVEDVAEQMRVHMVKPLSQR